MEDRYLPVFEEADAGEASARSHKKKPGTGRVVLVQCICCAVLILFFWLFKVLGGNAYAQLRTAFMDALHNNALMATVAELFDDSTPDESYQMTDGTTAAGTTVTGSTTGTATDTTTALTTATIASTTAATDG